MDKLGHEPRSVLFQALVFCYIQHMISTMGVLSAGKFSSVRVINARGTVPVLFIAVSQHIAWDPTPGN